MHEKHIHIIVFVVLFLIGYKPLYAFSQQCQAVEATITDMTEPEIGAYTLWDYDYGEFPDEEVFKSAFLYEKNIYAIGTVQQQSGKGNRSILLSKIDYRGRTVWNKTHEIERLYQVHKVVPHPKGMLVLATIGINENDDSNNSTIENTAIWMGVFDLEKGMLNSSAQITSNLGAKQRLMGSDIKPLSGGNGYVVAGYRLDHKNRETAVLYKTDYDGQVQMKRSYNSGTANKIQRLIVGDNGMLFIVGRTEDRLGRESGWAAGLDFDLKIMWDKIFPRGANAALLNGASVSGENSLIVTGWSESIGSEKRAAWIMSLGAQNGKPYWERYYRGSRAYEANSALWYNNSLSVVLNGATHDGINDLPKDSPLRYVYAPYIRLLTLNQRGSVIFTEDYMNAQSAKVSDMLIGVNKFRIMLGTTRSADPLLMAEAINNNEPVRANSFVSKNTWAIAIPAPSIYKDPCKE